MKKILVEIDCGKESCVGEALCQYMKATGNYWYCVLFSEIILVCKDAERIGTQRLPECLAAQKAAEARE